MVKKFSVIGGDLRSIKLAKLLCDEGNPVYIYGFKKAGFDLEMEECTDIESAVAEADIVIGPIPCSNDDETLNAPFHTEKIFINEVFRNMNKKQLFMAGRISEKISNISQVYNVYFIDILKREELAIYNAIPTAEGAIQIAMEEMPVTLHGCNAMVLGFGRIGKLLAKILDGLGANVYVKARKYSDISWIKAYNYNPVFESELTDYIPEMHVVFNTIPCVLLDVKVLQKVNKDTLIIDLASKPGGVDFDTAGELGIKTIWALSLPGKVAPITAAKYIKDTIYNIIKELGV